MLMDFEEKVVPVGCVLQRDGKSLVLKAHLLAGRMNKDQLHALRMIKNEYPDAAVRLATRQNIRIYGIPESQIDHVRDRLVTVGFLYDGRSTGVVVNANQGLVEEPFDVMPYAKIIMSWFDDDNQLVKSIPGKLKISVVSTIGALDNSSYGDMVFVAKTYRGQPCFDVLGGGSLGAQPRLAITLLENMPAERLIDALNAMATLFAKLFENSNIGKKRMRFQIRQMGEDRYISEFRKIFDELPRQKLPELNFEKMVEFSWAEPINTHNQQIIETNIPGIYMVKLATEHGLVSEKFLNALDNWFQELTHSADIAIDSNQTLFVRKLSGPEALDLLKHLERAGVLFKNPTVVSCAGTDYCRFGLANSDRLSRELEQLPLEKFPRMSVSGCMNSCAAHQMGAIGFWGRGHDENDVMEDQFEVTLGGCRAKDGREAKLAANAGMLKIKDIRQFSMELLAGKEASGKDWDDYLEEQFEKVKEQLKGFQDI